MAEGYIYLLENRFFHKDIVKIGKTTRSPEERAVELSSSSGVPFPFKVFFAIRTIDCDEAERQIHFKLRNCYLNKEFFYIAVGHAIQVIQRIVKTIGALDPPEDVAEEIYFRKKKHQNMIFDRGVGINSEGKLSGPWTQQTSQCEICGRVFDPPIPGVEQCALGHSIKKWKYLGIQHSYDR